MGFSAEILLANVQDGFSTSSRWKLLAAKVAWARDVSQVGFKGCLIGASDASLNGTQAVSIWYSVVGEAKFAEDIDLWNTV